MNKKEIKQLYLNYIRLYQKYNENYFDKNKPLVTDYEFEKKRFNEQN